MEFLLLTDELKRWAKIFVNENVSSGKITEMIVVKLSEQQFCD